MLIVHLIARLNDGGPARVLAEWCKESRQLGHQVRILCGRCASDEPDIGPLLIMQGIQVDYIEELGRKPSPLRDLRSLWVITRYLRRYQPDMLHTHTAKAGLLGRLCAKYLRLPCLHSYHGHVLHGYWSPKISKVIRLTEQIIARWGHCHSLTASLVHELSVVHRIGSHTRWHTLPIPIAPLSHPPANRHDIAKAHHLTNWTEDTPCIGFLGRLAPVKDPLLFVDVVRELAQKQKIQVIIAGDGLLKREVEEALASLPSTCHAWQVGFIPAEEALALMDVLVLTSHNEGTPLTIIEAASLEIPVVAPKVGGIRDMTDSPFLYRSERSAAELATGVNHQLLQPKAFIQEHARQFTQKYNPQHLVPRYIAIYQKIALERNRVGNHTV